MARAKAVTWITVATGLTLVLGAAGAAPAGAGLWSVLAGNAAVGQKERADAAANPSAGRSVRASGLLTKAIDCYRRGDYEQAATLFAQVQAGKSELSAAEQQDLASCSQRNSAALQARKDGAELLRQAEQAQRDGRPQQANDLLKRLAANREFLCAEDRARADQLAEPFRAPSAVPAQAQAKLQQARVLLSQGSFDAADKLAREVESQGPAFGPGEDSPKKLREEIAKARTDPRFLLIAGRAALQRNDLDRADELAVVADKAASAMSAQFRGDSPSNLRKDVQAARAKADDARKATNAQAKEGPAATQSPKPSAPDAERPKNTEAALRLMQQARKALEQGNLAQAEQLTDQARALKPELQWWDTDSPDKLAADVQRAKAAAAPQAVKEAMTPADPRALLKQGREQLAAGNLDEAARLAQKAKSAGNVKWGLFEYTPDNLLGDVDKARTAKDKENAAKALAEGRKLFEAKDLEGARQQALLAQKLHGPYGIWDLGDRPTKLLADVEAAEAKNRKIKVPPVPPVPPAGDPEPRRTADEGSMIAHRDVPGQGQPAAGPSAKQRALQLVAEARQLQQQGLLTEARQKLQDARGTGAVFGADEDGPESALAQLNVLAYRRVGALVTEGDEHARGAAADPSRLQRAEAAWKQARALAAMFGFDTVPIDGKLTWVAQMRSDTAAGGQLRLTGGAGATPQPQAAPSEGRKLLDQARKELRRGETAAARRLAEDAFRADGSVRAEAEAMLRNIDTEEQNQRRLAAAHTFDAGVNAFKQKDYAFAHKVLDALEVRYLDRERQSKLAEILQTPEMQQKVLVAKGVDAPKAGTPGDAGKGFAGDLPPPGSPQEADPFREVRARQKIRFEKLRDDSLDAQRRAIEMFQAGQTDQAIELLKEFVYNLGLAELAPEDVAKLRNQVEARVQKFQVMKAQQEFDGPRKNQGGKSPLAATAEAERHKQQQVTDLMANYEALYREGKYTEAERLAQQAVDLDPENAAAAAAVRIARIQRQISYNKQAKDKKEQDFRKVMDDSEDFGPLLIPKDPLAIDREVQERSKKRGDIAKGIQILSPKPMEKEIEYKLGAPVNLKFSEMPLEKALDDIHTTQGINIFLDKESLRTEGINPNQPVNIALEGISLKSALNLMLGQLHLTHVIRDEALVITTEANGRGKLVQKIFQVADLIIPVQDAAPPGGVFPSADKPQGNPAQGSPGVSPYLGPSALQSGQPVSTPGTSSTAPGGFGVTKRGPSNTIEDLLIKLITSTVKPETWSEQGGQGKIDYYPLGTALIVNQTPDIIEQVEQLLAALRRLQDLEVAIEVRFITVAEGFFERIGVDFQMNIKTDRHTQKFEPQLTSGVFKPAGFINDFSPKGFLAGLAPGGAFTTDLDIPIRTGSFGAAAPPPFGGFSGAIPSGGLDVGLAFLSDIQVFLFLEAVQGDSRTNVMQAPKLTMFNGQTATLNVSTMQSFITSVQVQQGPNGIPIFVPQPTISPVGMVFLTLQPVVSADRRFVRLSLAPTLSNLASAIVPLFPVVVTVPAPVFDGGFAQPPLPIVFTQFIQQPVISTINVMTTVVVPDGGTVLLGGLKRLSEGRNEVGPPVLSKIPYVNRLFKNVGYAREAESLLIMVTPRIIIIEEEEEKATGIRSGPPS